MRLCRQQSKLEMCEVRPSTFLENYKIDENKLLDEFSLPIMSLTRGKQCTPKTKALACQPTSNFLFETSLPQPHSSFKFFSKYSYPIFTHSSLHYKIQLTSTSSTKLTLILILLLNSFSFQLQESLNYIQSGQTPHRPSEYNLRGRPSSLQCSLSLSDSDDPLSFKTTGLVHALILNRNHYNNRGSRNCGHDPHSLVLSLLCQASQLQY